jgi:hypothetical protein
MSDGMATHVYEDRFGAIIDRAASGYVELRWYDTTEEMSKAQFQDWLTGFADEVERRRRPGVLVDGTRFLMDRGHMDNGWRDEQIIPRYNVGGVQRFAFHMPEGMPAVGAPPMAEGPATFPTGYFARRQHALDWLNAQTSRGNLAT